MLMINLNNFLSDPNIYWINNQEGAKQKKT